MPDKNFEDLVNDHSRGVLNTALRILGCPDSACDVHQEVFLGIWQRWDKFDGQTNWQAYLYRTTVRKAIEYARKSRKYIAEPTADIAASDQPPDAQIRVAELQQKLAVQLAKLPKRQADVFVLSKIEGLRSEKIAEVLGCSYNTVRVHLHWALKQLARRLSDYLE